MLKRNSDGGLPDLSVVTLTGDRPAAYPLLVDYMARQEFQLSVEWLIVDDSASDPFDASLLSRLPDNIHPQVIPRAPSDSPVDSFRSNMLCGLGAATAEKICFVEDDDWYSPSWLSAVWSGLESHHRFGERNPIMFNVAHRLYCLKARRWHASLCATAIRRSVLDRLIPWLEMSRAPQTADGTIWNRLGLPESEALMIPGPALVIGLKGLPGRSGLGIGHSREWCLRDGWLSDVDLEKLKSFIGFDVENYYEFKV